MIILILPELIPYERRVSQCFRGDPYRNHRGEWRTERHHLGVMQRYVPGYPAIYGGDDEDY